MCCIKEIDPMAYSFQITGIELLDFCLNENHQKQGEKVTYQFEINIEHRYNIESGIVFVICKVSIYNERKDLLFGNLKSSCDFKIENLATYFDEKTKVLQLPDQLVVTLNSLSVSTTRGLISSQFRGTSLHNAVLPVIDPNSFSIKNSCLKP